MQKFLAVVKHEYKKVVFKWAFLVGTLLFPLIIAGFVFVPAIIFSIKGEPTRMVVVDRTGKIAPRLKENLSANKTREKVEDVSKEAMKDLTASQEERVKRDLERFENSFIFIEYAANNKSDEQIESDLDGMIRDNELDAYLIIPEKYADGNADYQYFSRKSGDLIGNKTLEDALNNAVRSQRLADANISEDKLKELSVDVNWKVAKVDEQGEKTDDDASFIAGFAIAFMIYLILAIYGQMIMSAVVEEKETRVAEILFSSAKPFELMMGKLVGVGLAGLTQFAIWIISAAIAVGVAVPYLLMADATISVPSISVFDIIFFLIYFLLGFFLYASIFALIGSMVTTVQEGGQFAFLPIMLMLGGFYFSFAVVRDTNSTLSFWASILPFIAPMTMPIRILSEMPPLWQIALSIAVNLLTIAGLIWLASRVYRVGMLMYGKRATIPEVWKWIRQS